MGELLVLPLCQLNMKMVFLFLSVQSSLLSAVSTAVLPPTGGIGDRGFPCKRAKCTKALCLPSPPRAARLGPAGAGLLVQEECDLIWRAWPAICCIKTKCDRCVPGKCSIGTSLWESLYHPACPHYRGCRRVSFEHPEQIKNSSRVSFTHPAAEKSSYMIYSIMWTGSKTHHTHLSISW